MAGPQKISEQMKKILNDKKHMETMNSIFSQERFPEEEDPYKGYSDVFREMKGIDPSPWQHLVDSGKLSQEEDEMWRLQNWFRAQDIRRSGRGTLYDHEGNPMPDEWYEGWKPHSDRKPGEPLQIRRIEDKVMDSFIEADNKYIMGE